MLKIFLKILLFPLTGLVLAMAYPIFVGDTFKKEEFNFEARTLSPDLKPTPIGRTETNLDGKRVLHLEATRSIFPFSDVSKDHPFLAGILLSKVADR